MSDRRPVAVVEVGSGSVKLLVADADSLRGDVPPPVRMAVKTRLWSDGARVLDPAGLEATAAAFDRFAEVMATAGVDPPAGDTAGVDPPARPPAPAVAVVGTAVVRRVVDVEPLDRLCRAAFGVPLEVLSGEREAELGFAGAVVGRGLVGPVSLIDIGSGSTELATSTELPLPTDLASLSLPIGARSLTEAYLHGDPPGPDELSAALSVVELHCDDARRELPGLAPALAGGALLGVGAIGQIAAVEIGLTDPDGSVDGYRLTKAGVEEVFRALATECAADRAHNPGLLPEHVDDIVGGLCILVEFLRRFGTTEVIVSERDLRHGRAAELLATHAPPAEH